MVSPALSKKLCVLRGVQLLCPNCGRGPLYQSYLKQVSHCPTCEAALGTIRADDFPPWMTIILVGHLLIPFVLAANMLDVSIALQLAFWLPVTLALTLLLLPRCKGVAIGLMWSLDLASGSDLPKSTN